MKKPIVLGLIVSMVLSFSGCGFFGNEEAALEQAQNEFAEQGPVWTQELLQGYLDRESDAEMSYAGPFYFGSFDGIAPSSQNYSELRRQKVEEVIVAIDEGVDVMVKLDKKLKEEREIFSWYIKEIQTIDESTKTYTDQILGATKGSILSESLSNILVMGKTAKAMDLSPEWGFLQFQRYGAMVELTDLFTSETASLAARSVAMYYLLEADPNSAYQNLNEQFIAKMDPVSEEASEILSELYYKVATVGYGDKLLFTADYYFAKDAVASADIEIEEMKKLIAEYDGSNESISDEMLKLLKEKVQDLEDYRGNIIAYLDSIPSEELLTRDELAMVSVNSGNYIIPVAYAQSSIPGWFQKKVSQGIKTVKFVKDMSVALVRVAGKKVKEVYDTSGAHEVVKDGAQILNAGLEAVNSTVEVAIHGVQGLYYGDMSWEDFKQKIEDEQLELYEKFVAGSLGRDQYNELIHQVNQFQESTKRFVEGTSEFTEFVTFIATGNNKASKFVRNVTRSVGNEAKGVLDTATDFSKNLAIVMHPDTTKQQTREAMLGIYTALQGARGADGKLVNVELPDLTDLTKQKAMEEAINEMGLNQEQKAEFKAQLKEMFENQLKGEETKTVTKKDPKADAETKTSEVSSDAKTEAVAKILTNPDLSDEEAADLIIAEIMKGLPPVGDKKKEKKDDDNKDKDTDKDGIENEYDNCEKVANPDQTDTDLDSLGDACDPDCSGDTDGDEVCDEIDNCPSDANPGQDDADDDGMGNMCDFDAPDISELAGVWPGTIVVRTIYISDELRAQAEADGCDISEIEESKDEVKPFALNIQPTSETGGNIIISGDDSDEQLIPFTYVDGVLKANKSEDETSMNIEMAFNRNQSSGKLDISYMAGQAKVQADLDVAR